MASPLSTLLLVMSLSRLSMSHTKLSSQLEQLELGRSEYALSVTRSRSPEHGACWSRALEALNSDCASLNSYTQMQLALKFTICMLQMSGVSLLETCDPDAAESAVRSCLSDAHLASYTHFFTHVHNMCFYLRQQVWQQSLDSTVDRLGKSSLAVAEWMEESSVVQEQIVRGQRETLAVQRRMAEEGSMISLALEASKSDMKDIVNNFRVQTEEQRMLIFQIFDRVTKLQSTFLSEVSWIYNIVFYGISLLVLYLLTSSRRTSDARLSLFAIMTANFMLERLVCWLTLPQVDTIDLHNEINTTLHHRVWLVRQLSVCLCIFTIVYYALNYVDFNRVNNRLLEDIRRQNADLKLKMENMQVFNRESLTDATDYSNEDRRVAPLDESIPETIGSVDYSDEDTQSEMSFTSDRTFVGNNDGDVTDEDDVSIASGYDDTDDEEPNSLLKDWSQEEYRRSDWRRCSRASTPLSDSADKSDRYNFRSRKGLSPLLESQPTSESVRNFAKMVFQAANISQRNARKIVMAERRLGNQNHGALTDYSDDEN